MTYQEHRIVPVRFIGGSLDGDLYTTDYTEAELGELLESGKTSDFTPGTVGRGSYDVVDRYQVQHRPGHPDTEWAYVCTGTFELPPGERPLTAVFTGGPRDGQTATFLGTIRDRLWLATSHYPGYRLHHDGADPLTGWQMLPISDDSAR
jgi:hypothetical protein